MGSHYIGMLNLYVFYVSHYYVTLLRKNFKNTSGGQFFFLCKSTLVAQTVSSMFINS